MPPSEQSRTAFRARQSRLAAWLSREGLLAAVLDDFEDARCGTVRWLCGQPTDAILLVFATGASVLVPWDVNMAAAMAEVDRVIPYTDFKRSFADAVAGVLAGAGPGVQGARRVEFLPRTSYLRHGELAADLSGVEVVVRNDGLDAFLRRQRALKDPVEIASIEEAARITNEVIAAVEEAVASDRQGTCGRSTSRSSSSASHWRAGPRAWASRPLPRARRAAGASTASPTSRPAPSGRPGLSILDFGVRVDGYTTDVTLTFARGTLSAEQERMVSLVEKAYAASVAAGGRGRVAEGAGPAGPTRSSRRPGFACPTPSATASASTRTRDRSFAASGELPDPAFLAGMVFTIEPGLYDPVHGGVRWENDVLITTGGPRVLTKARIVRLP